MSLVQYTNGPDTRTRQGACNKCSQIHNGARSGYPDRCCCCDPCRYFRTYGLGYLNPRERLKNNNCCRCLPHYLCATFTPNEGESTCCDQINTILFPSKLEGSNGFKYTGYLVDKDLTVSNFTDGIDIGQSTLEDLDLTPTEYLDAVQCKWRVESSALSISGSGNDLSIDHINITCLTMTGITIENVTLDTPATQCEGTVSFSAYNASKVKFKNRWHDGTSTVDPYNGNPNIEYGSPPISGLDCTVFSKYLSVYGRRTPYIDDSEIESVEFIWDSGIERWKYTPSCTNPSLHTEYIRPYGDGSGNYYVEFDFVPFGDTNDWAIPSNTYDSENPLEIREGMIQVNTLGCDLFIDSQISTYEDPDDGRFVRIHGGLSSRWEHLCDSCRCVPQTLCIIGYIDGNIISTNVTWDEYDSWSGSYGASGEYDLKLSLRRGPPCSQVPGVYDTPGGYADGCYITINNSGLSIPIEDSIGVECGSIMSFEMNSDYSSMGSTDDFNWIWAQSNLCGCTKLTCGSCSILRCGGNPDVLYAELNGIGIPRMDNPLLEETSCSLTIPMYFYQRFMLPIGDPPVLLCGWIGYATVSCSPSGEKLLRAQYSPAEGGFALSARTPDGSWVDWPNANNIDSISCDPYHLSYDSAEFEIMETCFWGCPLITEYTLDIVE